jgi:hypothetical protein
MEGESLLGQLPEPWKAQIHVDSSGIRKPYYINTINGESTDEGSWLGPLPSEWETRPSRPDTRRSDSFNTIQE